MLKLLHLCEKRISRRKRLPREILQPLPLKVSCDLHVSKNNKEWKMKSFTAYVHRQNLDERYSQMKVMNLFLFDWEERIKAVLSAYVPVFHLFLFRCFSSVSILQHWSARTYVGEKNLLTPSNYMIILSETASTPYITIILPLVIERWKFFLLVMSSACGRSMEPWHVKLVSLGSTWWWASKHDIMIGADDKEQTHA